MQRQPQIVHGPLGAPQLAKPVNFGRGTFVERDEVLMVDRIRNIIRSWKRFASSNISLPSASGAVSTDGNSLDPLSENDHGEGRYILHN
jgi:hypothetical protein